MFKNIFGKKCEYCRTKIENENVIGKDVKVPGYIGTHRKNFCSQEHFKQYVEEINKKQRGGSCCG